jgi:UMF1 family MFS transporter
MALFERDALNPGVRRREVVAWAGYDFANSGYTTVVLTAVFNAYFVGVVAAGADWATLAWTAILAVSNVLVMLTMPAIGAAADRHGSKKRWLFAATVGCVIATAGLALCGRGDLALAALLIIVSNYAYSMGEALCGAFLPELARPRALGKVSGWGWSFGYLGGMLALGLSLAWVLQAQAKGQTAAQFVPVTMLITAVIYLVAAMPLFFILRERTGRGIGADAVAKAGAGAVSADPGPAGGIGSLRDVVAALGRTRGYPDFRRLLWTGTAYQCGISVVIALAAVYAEAAMGFEQAETMMLVFLVNIAAAAGAFAFGYAQDRIGHRLALAVTLVGWILMIAIAAIGTSRSMFWIAATLAGLCMGSSQSCGRALVGAFAPPARLGEFFGLWAFATRLAAIVGPLTYGLVTWVTAGNHRAAIAMTGVFFVVGLALLRGIDVRRGEAQARGDPLAAAPSAAVREG